MPSTDDYIALFDTLGQRGFKVDPRLCLTVRNKHISCDRCVESCVSGCINVAEDTLAVNPKKCIGCGTCVTACPTEAIQIETPSDEDIAREMTAVMKHNAGTVVIACANMLERVKGKLDPETVVKVACLGRIDESALLSVCAQGATRIILVSDDCETCAYCASAPLMQAVAESTQQLLRAWNVPCTVKRQTKFPKLCALVGQEQYDYQRREFLESLRSSGKANGEHLASYAIGKSLGAQTETIVHEHVTEDGILPQRQSTRRAKLMQTLKELGTPENVMIDTRLFGQIQIDTAKCNGCQMCAVFCPSAALVKHKEIDQAATAAPPKLYRAPGNPRANSESQQEGKPQKPVAKRHSSASSSSSFATGEAVDLLFAPSRCLACGSCQQLCPKDAITLSSTIRAKDLTRTYTQKTPMKDIYLEKGGPDAIKNSLSKLIDSAYIWG